MNKNLVFLDTETTGLNSDDEIVEIALVDSEGNVIYESYCKPTLAKTCDEAFAVHGIGFKTLKNAPTWAEIESDIKALLQNKKVVIFNSVFDLRLLKQTALAAGEKTEWIDDLDTFCAMYFAAEKYGATNRYGTISLVNAAAAANVSFERAAHSAAGDALVTRLVYNNCLTH